MTTDDEYYLNLFQNYMQVIFIQFDMKYTETYYWRIAMKTRYCVHVTYVSHHSIKPHFTNKTSTLHVVQNKTKQHQPLLKYFYGYLTV